MLTDLDTIEQLQNDWRDPYRQWYAAGMPAFYTTNLEPWKQIKVFFKTREDREKFAKLIGQQLTDKTNVIWHPEKERHANMLNRYVENV
jgi:hypothetical protein